MIFILVLFHGIWTISAQECLTKPDDAGPILGPCLDNGCPSGYSCYCDGCAPPPPPTTVAPPPVTGGDCVENKNCALFVQNGFCQSTAYSEEQKAQFCPKSCGLCQPVAQADQPCTDLDRNCQVYVQNGFCSTSLYSMASKVKYCSKSCFACRPPPEPIDFETSPGPNDSSAQRDCECPSTRMPFLGTTTTA